MTIQWISNNLPKDSGFVSITINTLKNLTEIIYTEELYKELGCPSYASVFLEDGGIKIKHTEYQKKDTYPFRETSLQVASQDKKLMDFLKRYNKRTFSDITMKNKEIIITTHHKTDRKIQIDLSITIEAIGNTTQIELSEDLWQMYLKPKQLYIGFNKETLELILEKRQPHKNAKAFNVKGKKITLESLHNLTKGIIYFPYSPISLTVTKIDPIEVNLRNFVATKSNIPEKSEASKASNTESIGSKN